MLKVSLIINILPVPILHINYYKYFYLCSRFTAIKADVKHLALRLLDVASGSKGNPQMIAQSIISSQSTSSLMNNNNSNGNMGFRGSNDNLNSSIDSGNKAGMNVHYDYDFENSMENQNAGFQGDRRRQHGMDNNLGPTSNGQQANSNGKKVARSSSNTGAGNVHNNMNAGGRNRNMQNGSNLQQNRNVNSNMNNNSNRMSNGDMMGAQDMFGDENHMQFDRHDSDFDRGGDLGSGNPNDLVLPRINNM